MVIRVRTWRIARTWTKSGLLRSYHVIYIIVIPISFSSHYEFSLSLASSNDWTTIRLRFIAHNNWLCTIWVIKNSIFYFQTIFNSMFHLICYQHLTVLALIFRNHFYTHAIYLLKSMTRTNWYDNFIGWFSNSQPSMVHEVEGHPGHWSFSIEI